MKGISMIKVKFISIHDIPVKELYVDTGENKTISMMSLVKELVAKTGVDFAENKESYMFMRDWEFLDPDKFKDIILKDLDCITVMPMVFGG
jgi:sulfur carrier protein ThiS